jgi:hypothetical protein
MNPIKAGDIYSISVELFDWDHIEVERWES